MKINLTILFSIISLGLFAQDSVTVTFNINTAGVRDLITTKSTVIVFSEQFGSIRAKNVGGDYWKASLNLLKNTSYDYKYFTDSRPDIALNSNGIEADLNTSNGMRKLTVGDSDINTQVEWVNGWNPNKPDPFETPMQKTDSIDVLFRVNVTGAVSRGQFDPETQFIGVRGNDLGLDVPPLSWGFSFPLESELPLSDGSTQPFGSENFWSGTIKFPANKIGSTVDYKFVISPKSDNASVVTWEDGENRKFTIPNQDTTLAWRHFNGYDIDDGDYIPETKTYYFETDLDYSISTGSFHYELDTLYVITGLNSTSDMLKKTKMENFASSIFKAQVTTNVSIHGPLQYAYYKVSSKQANQTIPERELFMEYDQTLGGGDIKNVRSIPYQESDTIYVEDIVNPFYSIGSFISSRRFPVFPNNDTIENNTTLYLEVDYRPLLNEVKNYGAEFSDFSGEGFVVRSSNIDSFGVYVNGPITRNIDGKEWAPWNKNDINELRRMYDDGTHGDLIANDSIYTTTLTWLTTDYGATVTQLLKFGVGGYNVEAPDLYYHIFNFIKGQNEQRSRYPFGIDYPMLYPHWEFFKTISDGVYDQSPSSFYLSQNYPNPFNPTTVISYQLSALSNVRLVVYDVLGREIAMLVNSSQPPGSYSVPFSGSDLTSGIYFYKLTVGSFSNVKKMMVVK